MSRIQRAALPLFLLVAAGFAGGIFWTDDAEKKLAEGQDLLASARFADAARVLAGVEGDPANSAVVLEARLLESRALLRGGDGKGAAERAHKVLDALPRDHGSRGLAEAVLAEAFDALGRHDESARLYGRRAAEVLGEGHRSRVAGYYLTLAAALEAGSKSPDPLKPGTPPDPTRAATLYAKALATLTGGKPLASVSLPLARCFQAAGDAGAAARTLAALLEVEKNLPLAIDAEARFRFATALLESGDAAKARTELERLIAMPSLAETPYLAEGLRLQGEAFLAMGGVERLRDAVATWRRYLELFPDRKESPVVRAKIGTALFDAGFDDEAIPAFRATADDAKADATLRAGALFGIANAERRLQRFEAARESLRRFLAAWPDDARVPEAQKQLANSHLEEAAALRAKKDDAAAVLALKRYVEEFPLAADAATVAVEIGRVLRAMKRFDDASAAFAAARDRYRAAAKATAADAAVAVAVILEEDRGNLEDAVSAYRKVTTDFPGTSGAAFAAGRLADLERIEIEVATKKIFRPGEPAAITLSTRNVPQATIRVYRLNAREFFESRGSLDRVTEIEVALVKADGTMAYEVPDYRRYLRRETQVPITLEEGKALPSGAYLVAVEAEERRSVVSVLVSPVRVVVKQSPFEVFCWAVDAETGEPRQGVEILVRGPDVNHRMTSGKDGVARLVHERARGRCEVLGVFEGSVAPGLAPEAPAPGKETLVPRVSFLLDRPIYRPGSEVRFQAVVRSVENGRFVTPEKAPVGCRLVDPHGRTIAATTLESGAFGTVAGDFRLPPEGAVGEHLLRLEFAGHVFEEKVPVEDYAKPEYEVTVQAATTVVRPGDPIEAAVRVAYYFGGPLRQAPYEWAVYRVPHEVDTTRYQSHAWYLRAVQASAKEKIRPEMERVASGAGSLDSKGLATFGFPSTVAASPFRYLIQVAVKDTSGRFVTGQGIAYSGRNDRFAVVLTEQKTVRAGETIEARVVTATLGHRPVATRGRIRASIRRTAADGETSYEVKAEAAVDTGLEGEARVSLALAEAGHYVLRFDGEDGFSRPVVAEAAVVATGERRDLAKEAELRFDREVYRGGETARLHLSVPKAPRPVLLTFEGERVLDYRILRVSAPSSTTELEIAEELAPNVVVAAAVPNGDELLTAEDRILVLRYLQVSVVPEKGLTAPGATVPVQVTTKDQLGRPVEAAVAVRLVDGALSDLAAGDAEDPRYVFNRDVRPHLVRTGSTFGYRFTGETVALDPDLLAMEREERRKLAETKARARGREMLRAEIARDAPAEKDTEIADHNEVDNDEQLEESKGEEDQLSDKKADGTRSNDAIGIGGGSGGSFGGRRGGAVRKSTQGAKAKLAPKELAQNPAAPATEDLYRFAESAPGGEGKANLGAEVLKLGYVVLDAGGLPLVDPVLRESFRDVAGFWPAIVTDRAGTARFDAKLPDNLTTWEFLGHGATRGVSVGEARATLRAAKDVVVRLERPRFLTTRDEITLPAVVHSNLDEKLGFELAVGSRSPALLAARGMTDTSVEIDPLGVVRTDFGFAAKAAGVAELEASARSTVASDALRVGMPIIPFGEPWNHVVTGELVDRRRFTITVPGNAIPGSESYRLIVQAGFDGDLLDGLGYLLSCPHGGLEPSLARWLPAMLLEDARRRAGRPPLVDPPSLRQEIEAGLGRLLSFANPAGGFSFWPKGPSDPAMTALAMEAIARAKALGYAVPSDLEEAATNGARALVSTGGIDPDARAALALALAAIGAPDASAVSSLGRERGSLSVAGLSRLILAAQEAGMGTVVPLLVEDLRARRDRERGTFSGRTPGTWHASSLEANALAALALGRSGASATELAPIVEAIRNGLRAKEGGTKAVAAGLQALAAYVATEGVIAGAGTVVVRVDGKQVAEGAIEAGRPWLALELPVAALAAGDHALEVEKRGGEAATCRVVLRHVRPANAVPAAGNAIEVRRRVTEFVDPDQPAREYAPGYEIVAPATRPRAEPLPAKAEALLGSKLSVELTIEAKDHLAYVVIEDPLMAGLDPIESGIRGNFDRFERRDAKLVFVKNRLARGERLVVTYPCWVVHAGRFAANPARAEELYAPERYGRSNSSTLLVVQDVAQLAQIAPRPKTADELYRRGIEAFEASDYAAAVLALETLPSTYDLENEAHDRILSILLRSRLRLERWKDAVRTYEIRRGRGPASDRLDASDEERLGRAYLAVGDALESRTHFQFVVLEAFAKEAEVAASYRELGLGTEAATRLAATIVRYPALGEVLSRRRGLAEWWLEVPDDTARDAGVLLGRLHGSRWRAALREWASIMAWEPKTAVAEEAGARRLAVLESLGLAEAVVAEAAKFVERHPRSERAAGASLQRAKSLFKLGRYDEAFEEATRTRAFEIGESGPGAVKPKNPFADEAAYLLGKIAHVRGDYDEAVRWYGLVKEKVPDANSSHAFFTMEELRVPPTSVAAPGKPVSVGFEIKNLDTVRVQLYPVDLVVLFAMKKGFERLATAELSGIAPTEEIQTTPKVAKFRLEAASASLGERKKGAYLVVLRSGRHAATSLLLVSSATLRVQRSDGSVRAYFVDGEGRPIRGARVKVGHQGRIVFSGTTDERGLVDLRDPGTGAVTVVAEKADDAAVSVHP